MVSNNQIKSKHRVTNHGEVFMIYENKKSAIHPQPNPSGSGCGLLAHDDNESITYINNLMYYHR
jgi:hypothetical protein